MILVNWCGHKTGGRYEALFCLLLSDATGVLHRPPPSLHLDDEKATERNQHHDSDRVIPSSRVITTG